MTDGSWDHDGGRMVPPYVVTGGRTRSTGADLALETLVALTSQGGAAASRHVFEQRRILDLCARPQSIAEVASDLGVPSGVAKVLIGDLVAAGLLRIVEPADTNEQLIRRLIDGVRSL